MDGSPGFSLNLLELRKVGKGLLIALIGAALTYLSEYMSGADFGMYTPVIVAVWSVVTNFVQKFIVDNSQPDVLPDDGVGGAV
jgi:hypothetical protein